MSILALAARKLAECLPARTPSLSPGGRTSPQRRRRARSGRGGLPRRAASRRTAAPACLARLLNDRVESGQTRDLLGATEAARLADLGKQIAGQDRADTVDCLQRRAAAHQRGRGGAARRRRRRPAPRAPPSPPAASPPAGRRARVAAVTPPSATPPRSATATASRASSHATEWACSRCAHRRRSSANAFRNRVQSRSC